MDHHHLDDDITSKTLKEIKDNRHLAFVSESEKKSHRELSTFFYKEIYTVTYNFHNNLLNIGKNIKEQIINPSVDINKSIDTYKKNINLRDNSPLFRSINLYGLTNGMKDFYN